MSYLEATTFFHPISDRFYARVKTRMIFSPPPSIFFLFHEWTDDLPVLQLHCSTPSSFHLFFFRYLFVYLFIHPFYSFIIILLSLPWPHSQTPLSLGAITYVDITMLMRTRQVEATVVINSLRIFYYWPCTAALVQRGTRFQRGRVSGFSSPTCVYLTTARH